MTQVLKIGFSPCPNDTFIFHGLMHGRVTIPGVTFRERIEDVETLNRLALDDVLDITKVSCHAAGHLRDRYAMLRSGNALGRGCGPLIVVKPGTTLEDIRRGSIAVPGELTTAALLLRLFDPSLKNVIVITYDRIMQAVAGGDVAAGLIIHESRFTYHLHSLEELLDLGAWWEQSTGLPVPLGCILGRRTLGRGLLLNVEQAIRKSIIYSRSHTAEALEYCGRYAREMDRSVMLQHIGLYVNDYSFDLGAEGLSAVRRLFDEAEGQNIIPSSPLPLLAEDIPA